MLRFPPKDFPLIFSQSVPTLPAHRISAHRCPNSRAAFLSPTTDRPVFLRVLRYSSLFGRQNAESIRELSPDTPCWNIARRPLPEAARLRSHIRDIGQASRRLWHSWDVALQ